jgi:hypothetical protein
VLESTLEIVSNAHSGLGLVGNGETVVKVFAQTEVEVPVTGFDLVFNVEGQLFDVGMTEEKVVAATAGEVVGRKCREVIRILASRAARALRGVGVSRQRVPIGVHAGRAEWIDGIDDAEAVVLAQEGLFVLRAGLEVVMPAHV